MAAESAQTLERGLRLLRLLADGKDGRTPTELSTELSLSRPVVYRLLTTLMNEGFVRRDADGRVHLGFGVLVLAQAVQPLLRATAMPTLRRLAEQVGATAHLTVAEGDDGLAVAVVEPSWTDMHVAYREGSRHPLAKGAAGRAILGLREGRDDYFVTEGQLQEGARGVAAPVTGLPWLEASVGVVTFGPLEESTGPRVVAAAAELAAALG
ncbi:ArsR family transcriptional regulator [Nonomuraea sp. KC401]|uniref:ArsR family transcriptional regulator n=1 Tax=Nonomuraea longispora TaxID=1848320 RepID=A0A4R4MX28_9ACTN|nr:MULTISPECIES: helix-turn-helix domain-containing protein [Nonomuraea]NBE98844.1 helix-turn-helix domain-containing protein [Nonomuraea sp. K271]TDC00755.1 ArsR family transcriptional regulator [Nonomuraea longispora]TLF59365.1 ArsR family transcriptional regulator [Nonomuraea sp. KC401]